MGFDLAGKGGILHFNAGSWEQLHRLGTMYGWEPRGTLPPSDDYICGRMGWEEGDERVADFRAAWGGGYHSNEYQTVTDDDAAAWADAIALALADVPRHDALAHKLSAPGAIDPTTRVNPHEWFSGRNRQSLTRFIAFCRAGGFTIA